MFSEKYGYKPQQIMQCETVSYSLRCRIWNIFYKYEIKAGGLTSKRISQALKGEETIEEQILDRMGYLIEPDTNKPATDELKEKVLRYFEWYDVYDFIEIYLSYLDGEERRQRIQQYNTVLEQEKSAYRIISGKITPITNESEIQCIEQAADTRYDSVNHHIQKALSLYADIKSPDYENSIKESISAVEAMCCVITGITGKQATLGKTVKKLKESGVHIHSAMEKAFDSLYGYTSDENGIRHGGIDFTNAPAEDAKYMLISCSAFINYLIEKWSKINPKE